MQSGGPTLGRTRDFSKVDSSQVDLLELILVKAISGGVLSPREPCASWSHGRPSSPLVVYGMCFNSKLSSNEVYYTILEHY